MANSFVSPEIGRSKGHTFLAAVIGCFRKSVQLSLNEELISNIIVNKIANVPKKYILRNLACKLVLKIKVLELDRVRS
jgi:hypothetical protein